MILEKAKLPLADSRHLRCFGSGEPEGIKRSRIPAKQTRKSPCVHIRGRTKESKALVYDWMNSSGSLRFHFGKLWFGSWSGSLVFVRDRSKAWWLQFALQKPHRRTKTENKCARDREARYSSGGLQRRCSIGSLIRTECNFNAVYTLRENTK